MDESCGDAAGEESPCSAPAVRSDDDQLCVVGASQGGFGMGGPSGISNCADTVWDIRAVAQTLDPSGAAAAGQGATAVVNEGIALRVAKDDVATSCP